MSHMGDLDRAVGPAMILITFGGMLGLVMLYVIVSALISAEVASLVIMFIILVVATGMVILGIVIVLYAIKEREFPKPKVEG